MEKNKIVLRLRLAIFMVLYLGNFAFGGIPISITMESLKFDSGSKIYPGDGTPNEYSLSEYFCYHLSNVNTLTNDVLLRLKSNCPDTVILFITAKQSSGQNGFGNISYYNSNCTISTNYGTTILLSPDGAVPTSISKHDFNWEWTITVIPACNTSQYEACTITFQTHHCCYVLWDDPKAPMEEPWLNVLDKAVEYAGGTYQYEDEVITALATNIYNSGIKYNAIGSTNYTIGYQIKLDSLMDDFQKNITIFMDCKDFSNFTHILANSLGIYTTYKRIGYNIHCNYVLPAQGGANIPTWNYHQYVVYEFLGFTNVIDTSIKIDVNNNPFNPSFVLPAGTNMTESYYLDKLTEDNVSTISTGVCGIVGN